MNRSRVILRVTIPLALLVRGFVYWRFPLSPRPVFAEWRPGKDGYGWFDVRFVDRWAVSVYIDVPRNIVFVCRAAAFYGGHSFELTGGGLLPAPLTLILSTRSNSPEYQKEFTNPSQALYVGIEDGTITRFDVDLEFAARAYETFKKDTFPESGPQVLLGLYRGTELERVRAALDGLKQPVDKPKP